MRLEVRKLLQKANGDQELSYHSYQRGRLFIEQRTNVSTGKENEMKEIRKAYGNNSTSLADAHTQPGRKQGRKWTIGLIIALLGLIGSPVVSLGNDPQPIPLLPGERIEKVELLPALGDTRLEQLHHLSLRVSLAKSPKTPSHCLAHAYVRLAYTTMEQGVMHVRYVPVKIMLAAFNGSPPKDPDEKIPTGRAIARDPITGSPIEVRIEKANEEDLAAFLDGLSSEKREKLERGLGPDQCRILLEMKSPRDPEICLWVGIVHTLFEPLK